MKFLKDNREKTIQYKDSGSWLLRLYYWIAKIVFVIFSFLFNGAYRRQSFTSILFKKHFHQTSHYTEANRYPDLFEICRDYLKDKENPRILSFGCSTGEEVLTLSEYLPNATIIGADVSYWCIHECKKKDKNNKFSFLQSLSRKFRLSNNFDAIFCLAVFQNPANRHNENNEYSSEYTFEKFEQQLIVLDKKLTKGGLLFIDQCDFNFLETELSKKFEILKTENNQILNDRPLYNKTNWKISDTSNLYRVFVKL